MDNGQLGDIGAVINNLTKNPAALSALGSLMDTMNKKPAPEPPKPEPESQLDIGKLLGLMSSLSGSSQSLSPPPVAHSQPGPFGSKEDVKNRINLLNAVRPFLSKERQDTLDTIIKLLKLSELGELTKLLGKI